MNLSRSSEITKITKSRREVSDGELASCSSHSQLFNVAACNIEKLGRAWGQANGGLASYPSLPGFFNVAHLMVAMLSSFLCSTIGELPEY